LERILEHHAFRNSLRSSRFLRYVVEQWLLNDHDGEPIKERILGAELFGLDPAYDTNQYTVVRNAASDVRKRIALFYHEPGHEDEIRIELPSGSYMPCLYRSACEQAEDRTLPEESAATRGRGGRKLLEGVGSIPWPGRRLDRNYSRFLLFVVLLLMVGAPFSAWWHWSSRDNRQANMSALDLFWKPVLNDSPPEPVVLICVEQPSLHPESGQGAMPVGDAFATADFARLLDLKVKKFRIVSANTVPIADLESATVLLVGGVGNPWTWYMTEGLRFHFLKQTGNDSKETVWIKDRDNPSRMDWSLSASRPPSGKVQDFAILARVKDSKTGRWRVVAGGLDEIGTGIAARFLVEEQYTKELVKFLPANWSSRNVEAVIEVQVIDGDVGPAQVVATEVW
jgi:hypothetical protein